MFSRLFHRPKDQNPMERGAYSRLQQVDSPPEMDSETVALTESSAYDASSYPTIDGRRIDYVLVYETCKEKEDEDEETKQEAQTREKSRRFYERRLQKKGLILRHESIIAEKVTKRLGLIFKVCINFWWSFEKCIHEWQRHVYARQNLLKLFDFR